MATHDADKATTGQQQQPEHQNGQSQARQAADAPPSTTSSSLPPADQPPTSVAAQRAGLAQALEELARGERAADKLERELRVFEAKLEELLSSMGMTEEDLEVSNDGDKDDGKQEEAGGEAAGGQDTVGSSSGPASQDSKK